ncbi:MAG: ATP-binding protein, partial [Cyclonatronaceae bacterium]
MSLTNSIRHAFPDGREGTISVELAEGSKGTHLLTVKDDGIGYKKRGQKGLGLELVDGLVRQIKGTITFRNKKGTVVEV